MKYLLLCILFSPLTFAETTVVTDSDSIVVENTTAATFVQPLNVGGGDVFPMNSVLTAKSANCPSNQLILDLVNTSSGLRGSGAPSIGNYGMAGHIGVVFPFGDGGRCERLGEIIVNQATSDFVTSQHNFCMGTGESFKRANADVYFNDEWFENNESYKHCRPIYVTVYGIAHYIQ